MNAHQEHIEITRLRGTLNRHGRPYGTGDGRGQRTNHGAGSRLTIVNRKRRAFGDGGF